MPQKRSNENKYYQKIQKQLNILLNPQSDNWQEKREACHTIGKIFAETGIYNLHEDANKSEGIWLHNGFAVGIWSAAMCLLEYKRTIVFLAGLIEAVQKQLQETKQRPIHVLDAGCGPFALLSTLSCFYFKPTEVQFHLLDIFEENITESKKLAEALGISAFFCSYHCTDATSFQWPFNYPLDIVVSETMLNGLRKEPQVAISLNLSKQLHNKGLLIPEEVKILLALHHQEPSTTHQTQIEFLAEIRNMEIAELMRLNKQTSLTHKDQIALPTISMPEAYEPNIHHVALHTQIRVYGEHMLDYNDCSLTLPLFLSRPSKPSIPLGASIQFHYTISHMPGIKFQLQ